MPRPLPSPIAAATALGIGWTRITRYLFPSSSLCLSSVSLSLSLFPSLPLWRDSSSRLQTEIATTLYGTTGTATQVEPYELEAVMTNAKKRGF